MNNPHNFFQILLQREREREREDGKGKEESNSNRDGFCVAMGNQKEA